MVDEGASTSGVTRRRRRRQPTPLRPGAGPGVPGSCGVSGPKGRSGDDRDSDTVEGDGSGTRDMSQTGPADR